MNFEFLAAQNYDSLTGGFGMIIGFVVLFLALAAVLMPLYVYEIYRSNRRIEKRLDVLLDHTARMVAALESRNYR